VPVFPFFWCEVMKFSRWLPIQVGSVILSSVVLAKCVAFFICFVLNRMALLALVLLILLTMDFASIPFSGVKL
jgi:hypothetical protein